MNSVSLHANVIRKCLLTALGIAKSRRINMANISRNWNRMNRDERITFARTVIKSVQGNPQLRTDDPAFAELKMCQSRASDSVVAVKILDQKRAEFCVERDAAIDALMTAIEAFAQSVEKRCGDDADAIASTGYELVQAAILKPVEMTQVINFSVTAGDFDGELDVHWDAVRGASLYDLQICMGKPDLEENWTQPQASSPMRSLDSTSDPSDENKRVGVKRTRATLTDLPSGKRVWLRVCAIGENGAGPWSETRSKIVP